LSAHIVNGFLFNNVEHLQLLLWENVINKGEKI
jgi:hypothetical protein